MNLLPATVISDDGTLRVTIGDREVALPRAASGLAAGAGVTLGIRPEHIDVAPETGMLAATVDLVERLGGETFIYASAPGLPQITLRQDGQSQLYRGDAVAIQLRPRPPSHLRRNRRGHRATLIDSEPHESPDPRPLPRPRRPRRAV